MSNEPRRTPLFDLQRAAGARFIAFGEWEMPVQFSSILDEHKSVRTACGVFDISHMGEIFVSGPASLDWLQHMLANDLSKCPLSSSQYTFLLNERGGIIDDLIVYRLDENEFLLLVNASKIDEDMQWLTSHGIEGVTIDNRSESMCALAVQGPNSSEVFRKVFERDMPERGTFSAFEKCRGAVIAAGTGYTGEIGFELFFSKTLAADLWNAILDAGAKPCGLGARDTLRLEMCYPLNGSDLSPDHTPLEAGLGFFVSLDKPDFIGRDALLAQKSSGLPSRLVALRLTEKSPPPRSHYSVLAADSSRIGETSSGALSPSLAEGIALAYLPPAFATIGTNLFIEIRGRQFPAMVEKKPFYKSSSLNTKN